MLERSDLLKYASARVESEAGSIRREQCKNLTVSSHDVYGPCTPGGQNLLTHDVGKFRRWAAPNPHDETLGWIIGDPPQRTRLLRAIPLAPARG